MKKEEYRDGNLGADQKPRAALPLHGTRLAMPTVTASASVNASGLSLGVFMERGGFSASCS